MKNNLLRSKLDEKREYSLSVSDEKDSVDPSMLTLKKYENLLHDICYGDRSISISNLRKKNRLPSAASTVLAELGWIKDGKWALNKAPTEKMAIKLNKNVTEFQRNYKKNFQKKDTTKTQKSGRGRSKLTLLKYTKFLNDVYLKKNSLSALIKEHHVGQAVYPILRSIKIINNNNEWISSHPTEKLAEKLLKLIGIYNVEHSHKNNPIYIATRRQNHRKYNRFPDSNPSKNNKTVVDSLWEICIVCKGTGKNIEGNTCGACQGKCKTNKETGLPPKGM